MSVTGHLWTVLPNLLGSPSEPSTPFFTTVDDPYLGSIRLTGWLDEVPESDTAALIVHGFGGDANSRYCAFAARAARKAGYSALRLNLRGADLSGEDIYHGGLTEDLRAALRSPELRKYRKVYIIGYSVGGCIALRAAIEKIDPRIRGVAAVCSPIDLEAGAVAFDDPSNALYRRHVFHQLNRVYKAAAARRPMANPPEVVECALFTKERDEVAVIPRFGFPSVDAYYEKIAVASDIHRLDIPGLLIVSENDPIVSPKTVRDACGRASRALTTIHTPAGGHLYFPSDLDLGQGGRLGLASQVVTWLSNQS